MTLRAPHTVRLGPPEPGDPHYGYGYAQPAQGSVMIIDDSMTVRAVIEASLRRNGFAVTSFADGLQAMGALARGEAAVPDLLLLDIGLPKMDGYEVAKILRAKPDFSQTVLVILTGHDGVFDRIRSKMVGASAFITKPFRVRHVLDVVSQYLPRPVQP